MGDWTATELALTSADKAAKVYWEDEEEVGIIKVKLG